MKYWQDGPRSMPLRDQAQTWRAAARGAHVDGKHETELRYRNTARLIEKLPPLPAGTVCIR